MKIKVLVIGNISSGKTILATKLASKIDNSFYVSIDELRKKYGDGSFEKEFLAWSKFLHYCEATKLDLSETGQKVVKVLILEFTGAGCFKHSVKEALKNSNVPVVILFLDTPVGQCIKRVEQKSFNNIPYPWKINPTILVLNQIDQELKLDQRNGFWRNPGFSIVSVTNPDIEFENILRKIKEKINNLNKAPFF